MDCVAVDSEVVVGVVIVMMVASSTLGMFSLLVWQSVEECVIGTSIVALTCKLITLTTASHSFDFNILKTDIVWALFHYRGHHLTCKLITLTTASHSFDFNILKKCGFCFITVGTTNESSKVLSFFCLEE